MDAKALQGSHLAIIGNSGSGKSYAIRRLLEDSWGQSTHIVFDVEDEFHSLTADYPYVLVNGEHAQIRVSVANAAVLARRVVTSQVSVIIQLNSLEMPDRQRFIAAFLNAMLGLQRKDWRRCLVVIDEADKYAPQGQRTESTGTIINFMAMGRKRGFVGVLATQRAAKISKSAVSECANWMIGRQIGMNDRRVAAEQLGFRPTDDEMKDLPSLAPGRFWRTGPAFGERRIEAVPPVRTKHLGFGETFTPERVIPELAEALQPPAPVFVAPTALSKSDRSGRVLWALLGGVVALMAGTHLYAQALLP